MLTAQLETIHKDFKFYNYENQTQIKVFKKISSIKYFCLSRKIRLTILLILIISIIYFEVICSLKNYIYLRETVKPSPRLLYILYNRYVFKLSRIKSLPPLRILWQNPTPIVCVY